ncbi:hypothetical protein PENSPDRAFT_688104 [Peniophora sp. CONT]|nr:hypothetical protein PENSPDRAFT_688104 [Peniophora sp. CONT]
MGQRHQIFVIACVRRKGETTGQRRCVAAYHHQWCYGLTALYCLSRFLRLASQPENSLMIRRDIASVQGNWGEVPQVATEVKIRKECYVPCPFIAYLMQLAWNVNLDDVPVYVAGTTFTNSVLDARMQSSGAANNDGITIVDVTDPANASYCFNKICGPPLTAEDYVRKYYPRIADSVPLDDDQSEDADVATEHAVVQTIAALEPFPLMSIDSLVEAWPQDYTRARDTMVAAGTYVSVTVSPDESLPATPAVSIPPLSAQPAVHSLTDISLRQAVLHAVNEGNHEPIQDSLSTPGQREVILSTLCDISPLPPAGSKLLDLAIGREQLPDVLDLSGINLSLSAILGRIGTMSGMLYKLDLSGNDRVTVHDLSNVISAAPRMRELIIFDCPLIADEDMYGLLASSPESIYALEFIGHSAFFRRARDKDPACPYVPAFTCVVYESMRQPLTISLPYFTPSRLLRSIYTLLKSMADTKTASLAMLLQHETGQTIDPTLAGLSFSGSQMFTSTAVLHAAFTTWYAESASITDAIRVAQLKREPDPSGLRADTQRITLIPQMSTSFDGWLLLMEPTRAVGGRFAIARKRRNGASADQPPAATPDPGLIEMSAASDFEVFSLDEFVVALKAEGRPAPPAEDVAALARVIEIAYPAEQGDCRLDPAGVAKFLNEVALRSMVIGQSIRIRRE